MDLENRFGGISHMTFFEQKYSPVVERGVIPPDEVIHEAK